jgi:hypothetical protein
MDRDQFAHRLRLATTRTVDFGRRFVWNGFPAPSQYLVHLSRDGAKHIVHAGEIVFPEDALRAADYVGPLDVAGVVALVWRAGKIPEWINMSVQSVDETSTYLELVCCARFTDRERLLYFPQSDICPFQVRGPAVPPGWQGEDGDKFDLHWRHQPRQ